MTTPAQPPTPPATPATTPPAPTGASVPGTLPLAGLDGAPPAAAPPATPPATPPPAQPPAAAPPAPAPAAVASPDEGLQFPNAAALQERMARHTRSELRQLFGTENVEEIQAQIQAGRAAAEAEAARRAAEQTEAERLAAARDAATQRAEQAEAERDQARFERQVTALCSQRGIRNVDYATYAISQAANSLEAGQELDPAAYLDQLLGDDQQRAALGALVTTPAPVTTAPTAPGATPPTPPPAGGTPAGPVDVMSMTQEQFEAHKARVGLGGGS